MGNRNRVHYDARIGTEVKRCVNPDCTEKPVSEFYSNGKGKGYHGKCKACEKVTNKIRYDENPEKYRAAVMESAYKHPDRQRARYQRWAIANKERRIQYYREYNEAHRKERRAYARVRHSKETPELRHMWYEKRRDYMLEYGLKNKERKNWNSRIWKQKYPARHLEAQLRRRARKHNASRIEKIDHLSIIERDNWICYLCGQICTPLNVTLDHVIPLIHHGSHTADNLRVACRICNCRKGARSLKDFLK